MLVLFSGITGPTLDTSPALGMFVLIAEAFLQLIIELLRHSKWIRILRQEIKQNLWQKFRRKRAEGQFS